MWKSVYFEPDRGPRKLSSLADLASPAASESGILWLDLHSPGAEEIAVLSDVFRLDPLIIEDCVAELHHPKADAYDKLLFLVVHGVHVGAERGKIKTLELDIILTQRILITFRAEEMSNIHEVWDRMTREEGPRPESASVILQHILASQAILHLREVERLHEDLVALETGMFDHARKGLSITSAESLFDIKADLARLRAIMGSQRDVMVRLFRGEFPVIPQSMLMQFRDVYDDIHRATETIDLLREISGTALDTYLMLATHRTNEIVKILTILATFILPLTLITGWYGMNFHHMLGLDWKYGEVYVLGLFLAVCGGLGIYLKRRGWL